MPLPAKNLVLDRPKTPTRNENQTRRSQESRKSLDRGKRLEIQSPSKSLDSNVSPGGKTVVGVEEQHASYNQSSDAENQVSLSSNLLYNLSLVMPA